MLLYWLEPIALRKPTCASVAWGTLQCWLFFSYHYLSSSLGTPQLKHCVQASSSLSMSVLQTCAVSCTLPLPLVILLLQRVAWRSFPPPSLPDPSPWSLGWSLCCVFLEPIPLSWPWPCLTHTSLLSPYSHTPTRPCSWGQGSQLSCHHCTQRPNSMSGT